MECFVVQFIAPLPLWVSLLSQFVNITIGLFYQLVSSVNTEFAHIVHPCSSELLWTLRVCINGHSIFTDGLALHKKKN